MCALSLDTACHFTFCLAKLKNKTTNVARLVLTVVCMNNKLLWLVNLADNNKKLSWSETSVRTYQEI